MIPSQADEPFHRMMTSFGGFPASQVWADFLLWELVLNEHDNVRAIVEIGTLHGGFSRYLAAQADARGLDFRTYDIATPPSNANPPGFRLCDVFETPGVVERYLLENAPVALLCDNGNKRGEVETFGPVVARLGGVVVVHDWEVEFTEEDLPDGLAFVHEGVCDDLGSISRVMVAA